MTTEGAQPLASPLIYVRWPANISNLFLSFATCTLALLLSLLVSDDCHHWFVIPVLLCGTVVGVDALKWLRGQVDVFDPVGILGLMCLHVYFVAPLLHFYWNSWMPFIEPPDDWRPWVGIMACLNLAGWGIYVTVRNFLEDWLPAPRTKCIWQIEPGRFFPLLVLAMAGSAAMQAVVYVKFGGISGFTEAFIEDQEKFVGTGWMFILSEPFPILATMGVIYWARKSPRGRTWPTIMAILVGFFVLKMAFGGLRGSRGHTIYGLFWAAGMVHLMLRPIPRKLIAVAAAFLLLFMYGYLFYKTYGHETLDALEGGSLERSERLDEAYRGFPSIALGDFGRTDVQALTLYHLSNECPSNKRFDCVWGQTYLGAVALLIPSSIFPDKPPSKIKAGTDALFGLGVYENEFRASNAYGLAGEAMLNFGVVGAPLSFAVLGIVVVWSRRFLWKYLPDDSRLYLAPFAISLSYMVFIWDSDIVFFYLMKEGAIPSVLVFMGSRRIPIAWQEAAEGSA